MTTDRKLKNAVLAGLISEPGLNSEHIGVAAKSGVITLSGHVENHWQKHAAEAVARRVLCVKAVAEQIEVRPPGSGQSKYAFAVWRFRRT